MPLYTNVENVKIGLTSIEGVTQIQYDESKEPLVSTAGGLRNDRVVGDNGRVLSGSIEIEDQGISYSAMLGLGASDTLTFDVQEEDTPANVKTHTLTDIVITSQGYSSNKGSPNGVTLSFRTVDETDTVSVA